MRLYLTGDFEDFDYCVGVVEAEVAVVVDAASAGMIEGAVADSIMTDESGLRRGRLWSAAT
jgi:hypothetical protein